jgi:hypothetical protein
MRKMRKMREKEKEAKRIREPKRELGINFYK